MRPGYVILLATLLAFESAPGQGSPEGAWNWFSHGHSNAVSWVPGGTNVWTNILRITAFRGWSEVLLVASDNGIATVSVDDYNTRGLGVWRTQLSETNFKTLRYLLHDLAATTNSVPFWVTNYASFGSALPTNQLVMVSFRDGTNWLMRQFTDGALPDAVFRCYDLIIPTNVWIERLNRTRPFH